ncbi:MAG: 30S ribosomal protein S15 [Candidatus Micrarchaeia archaeon]
MVRLHTRKAGKAKRSKKHYPREAPSWSDTTREQIADMAVKLAKEGKDPAQIGVILRDTHAVPDVKAMTGKKLTKLLEEKGVRKEYPADLLDLIKRAARMRKHLSENHADKHNRTRLLRVESKIRRLVSYYNKTGRLNNWKYDPEQAALLVR